MGLLFDIDGTLAATDHLHHEALNEVIDPALLAAGAVLTVTDFRDPRIMALIARTMGIRN